LRALLVLRGGDGDVPRRRRDEPRGGGAGHRGARAGAAARDRLRGRAAGRGRRGAPARAPLRGAGLRRLSAAVKARLFTDGGARGNPGPAAFAYVLEGEGGTVLAAHRERIGVATNNVAEYRVKNEALRALSLQAAAAARRIGRVTYTAVRREHNELADRLVNEALDA